MRCRALLLFVLSLLMVALQPLRAAAQPLVTLEELWSLEPPARDLADLRRRIPAPSSATAPSAPSGVLWINDVGRGTYHTVQVELRAQTEHADWYVEQGREVRGLQRAEESFETTIWPRVWGLVGASWIPGAGGQPRIGIFYGRVPGVAGYMSSGDAYPRWAFPYSNERLFVYLNVDSARADSSSYQAALAHELEHVAHFTVNPVQEGWLDEGLAELVSEVVTGASPSVRDFMANPDVQLNAWGPTPSEARAHYDAAYLWVRYLLERAGGVDRMPELVGAGGQGFTTVERFLERRGLGDLRDLFEDWIVANLLDDPTAGGGRYGYRDLGAKAAVTGRLALGDHVDGRVHQFAADYYELGLAGPARLAIDVEPTVPLISSVDAHGGMFISVRGDNLDTRLTRRFDLSDTERATLRYRVWHDLEAGYDYCYVLASRDGVSWTPLQAPAMSDPSAGGLALGPGYTGASGSPPAWHEETVDLSPFAGAEVWLRFECVTDQGYSGPGFAVDDIAIPEIGFEDDATADLGWRAEGFLRTVNAVPQDVAVLVIVSGPGQPAVQRVAIDGSGHGDVALDAPIQAGQRVYVAVSGLTPLTLETMQYRLALEPR